MPSLAESITLLKVDGKTFKNPEWWASTHKIKREVKNEALIKELYEKHIGKINIRTSYRVVTRDEMPNTDQFVRTMLTDLDFQTHEKFAPWDPVFRKFKTLIMFDK